MKQPHCVIPALGSVLKRQVDNQIGLLRVDDDGQRQSKATRPHASYPALRFEQVLPKWVGQGGLLADDVAAGGWDGVDAEQVERGSG